MSLEQLIASPGGVSAAVLNPGTDTDIYNNVVDDWASATSETVRGWFDQTGTDEDLTSRDAVIVDGTFYCAPDAPISARSRLVIGGVRYEVVGQPLAVPTPRGVHHREVKLHAVAG